MNHRNKSSRVAPEIRVMAITTLLLSLVNGAWADEGDSSVIESLSINDLMQIDVS